MAGAGAAIRKLDSDRKEEMDEKIENGTRLFGVKALGFGVIQIPADRTQKEKFYFKYQVQHKNGATWKTWTP